MGFEFFDPLIGLAQVIAINVALSGDNAVVIGLAAVGLPANLRRKAIVFGIMVATILRIIFAILATHLLHVLGLLLAGGLLLLWIVWKMWLELRAFPPQEAALKTGDPQQEKAVAQKTLAQAITQIVIADISMSLDNVLAVAGAAGNSTFVLVAGLLISIALMGLAASLVARLLDRWHWIAYLGLAVIFYVAVSMIWQGGNEVWQSITAVSG